MALVGPRSFKQAMTFLIPFWILGDVFLGLIDEPQKDTYSGEVYIVTEKHGFPKPVPLNAKLEVNLSGGIRLRFSGEDLDTLRKVGIDPVFLDKNNNYYCMPVKAKTTRTESFFAGFENSYEGGYTSYSYAYNLAFRKTPNDPDCHTAHLGIIDFDNIQLAISDLNPTSFVFASLARDSHVDFIQRLVMRAMYDRNDGFKF